MTDDKWRVIQITKGKGWKILEGQDVPILFHRDAERHSRGQIEPVEYYPSDVMDKFIDVTNISKDDRTTLLFKSHLISLFIPTIAHPIFLFAGPKGSAKTQLQRFIKNIVDPDNLEITAIPKDEKDFVLEASKSRLLSYDNISYLERWFSDRACSAITGTAEFKENCIQTMKRLIFNIKILFL